MKKRPSRPPPVVASVAAKTCGVVPPSYSLPAGLAAFERIACDHFRRVRSIWGKLWGGSPSLLRPSSAHDKYSRRCEYCLPFGCLEFILHILPCSCLQVALQTPEHLILCPTFLPPPPSLRLDSLGAWVPSVIYDMTDLHCSPRQQTTSALRQKSYISLTRRQGLIRSRLVEISALSPSSTLIYQAFKPTVISVLFWRSISLRGVHRKERQVS